MTKAHNRPAIIGGVTILLLFAFIVYVWAGITTAATGGTPISADTAATGGTGAWTSISGPTYAETVNGDLASGGYVTLTAPTGFTFNTGVLVSVVLLAGDTNPAANMNGTTVGGNVATTANGSLVVTATTISFFVNNKSRGNTLNTIQWQGIQVRPTNGSPLASGNIIISVPSGSTAPSSSNAGTLTEVAGAMTKLLTVLPGQTFTAGTGIAGVASNQTAGNAFNLTQLVATDKFNNTVTTYSGAKTVSYTGPATGCISSPSYTTSLSFTNGISTTALATTLKKAETTTITASDGSVTGPASSSLIVDPAAMSQLVVTLSGQTFNACSGNSGTPSNQSAGVNFNISVITAIDTYDNIVTTYTGTKTLSYSGPTGANTYTTSVNFAAGQSTSTLGTTISTAQTTTLAVSSGTISGPASSSFIVNPTVSSFNAFESGTAVGSVSGIIKTKISGTAYVLDIVALTSAPAVSTSFTGTVNVELVDSSSGTCTTWPTIQTLASQIFSSADSGRHTILSITETNAWKNVRLRISYPVVSPTIVSCSSDNFAIRPSTLGAIAVTDLDWQTAGTTRTINNTALPSGVVHKAGQPFTINATGQNSSGVTTTNYSGNPVATLSQCGSGTAVCPPLANLGTLALGTWGSGVGGITTSTATYSDVGAFSMVLQDQHFADVDLADSTTSERYVTSSSINIGRFIPDHFVVTTGSITPRTDLAACSTSTFSYMSEPFGITFQLTAQNAAPTNGTTNNYAGLLATLDTTNPSHINFGAVDTTLPTALVAGIVGITQTNPGKVTTGTPHGLTTGAQVFLSGVSGMSAINNALYAVTVIDANNFTIGVDTTAFSAYTSGGNASRLSVSASTGT